MTPQLQVGRHFCAFVPLTAGPLDESLVAEDVVEMPMTVDDPPDGAAEGTQVIEQLLRLTQIGTGVDDEQRVGAAHDSDVQIEGLIAPAETAVTHLVPLHTRDSRTRGVVLSLREFPDERLRPLPYVRARTDVRLEGGATMTETTIPTTTSRTRGRVGVAALSLAVGATLGITGTVLATSDNGVPVRPTIVQRLAVDRPSTIDDGGESPCEPMSADAAERCLAARAEAACQQLSADAAEHCLAERAERG